MLAHVTTWLLTSFLLTLIGMPWMARAFPAMPRLGWGLSRTFGLLFAGWSVWILAATASLPFDRLLIGGVLGSLGTLSLLACTLQRRTLIPWLKEARPLVQEGLFLSAFLAYLGLRGFNPDILIGEKLSDAMYLSSLLNDTAMPPADLWFAGHPVNYYYFGYVLCATVAKLCGTSLGLTFNLSLALMFALSVSGFSALLLEWLKSRSASEQGGWLAVGLGFQFALGNLAAGVWLLQRPKEALQSVWDTLGMASTRVLTFSDHPTPGGAISEFPSFTFLFADLHPHLMAIPFSMLYLAGAYALARSVRPGRSFCAVMALCLGAFGSMNAWELPVAFGVLTLAAVVAARQDAHPWKALLKSASWLALVFVVGLACFIPFFQHFAPPQGAKGLHLILDSRVTPTSWLMHFGLFAYIGGSWLVHQLSMRMRRFSSHPRRRLGLIVGALGLLMLLAFLWNGGLLLIWGLALLAIGMLLLAESDLDNRFLLLMLGAGIGLCVVADLVVVHDRTNTIFKLYMPAWSMLALASVMALRQLIRLEPAIWRLSWHALLLGLIGLGAVFPVLAGPAWSQGFRAWRGIDGEAFLAQYRPDEAKALEWLRQQPSGALLEPHGGSWSEANRLAVFSGRPTLLGWVGHERLWHEGSHLQQEIDRRIAWNDALFDDGKLQSLREALEASSAHYLVVSASRHASASAELSRQWPVVFSGEDIRIFQLNASHSPEPSDQLK